MVGATNFEPRPGPFKPKNGFVIGTRIYLKTCVMLHHWNPTKKEIEKSLDQNIHEFVVQEKKNLCLSKDDWLDMSLYIEVHQLFFRIFPIE